LTKSRRGRARVRGKGPCIGVKACIGKQQTRNLPFETLLDVVPLIFEAEMVEAPKALFFDVLLASERGMAVCVVTGEVNENDDP
jgi:hypothetical protein